MIKIKTETLTLSNAILKKFQIFVDLIGDFTSVEYAGVLMYKGSKKELCYHRSLPVQNQTAEQTITSLHSSVFDTISVEPVDDIHKKISGRINTNHGVQFYSGYSLSWPDGSLFGAIVIVDHAIEKLNSNSLKLLSSFKESISARLETIYQNEKLLMLTTRLKRRGDSKTKDIASLNYTLSQEIDKRKAAEQEVVYHKNHDRGTGFLNQYSLLQHTKNLLIQAKSNRESIAVVHIAFSNGRKLQERYGEYALNSLLVAFRERIGLIDCIESVTARTSISNFIIAIRTKSLTPFIDNFCYRCLEICHSDFSIDNDRVHLQGFIGVSTNVDSSKAEDLIYFANEAAFTSKETGQKYSYYSESHTEKQLQINEIESYLLDAVRNNDLKLYYQPKVELKSGNWMGAEALIRWNHPVLGNVSNENLIQLAEQNGLIFEVGNFVLRSAIESASDWIKYNDNFKIAVNVSAIQLKNVDFAKHVAHLLKIYELPANKLELEITESSLISDEYLARKTLHQLSKLGVTLSLDDFGTGCASFSYLKNYPFNSLKIDKSFVQNLTRNSNDKEIVRSIVQIAKKLNLDVTIEGIENLDQERFVLNEGCDYAQGYLYGKAMTGDEFKQCIAK
ncbi:putative bifunctional diguanylate cyclase/phosphodiesterase [Vibrio algarum]|uniref:Bifunctional diguanylate cyclase/phosphodiesterase n=1 Tax=Vibrio algarum TaxID=3020714 RepID=A0ABT4YZ29_9VIBR|nr:bifunctional diguanylate cyclase/phosphodiesterase [Vibrio sp. KJ40-1]MDB1126299.1 bifunctional diguanylate cyclase/phosphodiesterase [Vibrio sp. KJ40-1]